MIVDSDRVRVGSGAHCEIRLPADQAAVEHVLVTSPGGGVQVQARALNPAPTVNGSPFTQTQLVPDSILGIGQVQMMISVVEISDNANVIKKKEEKTGALTYVLAIAAVPLAIFVLFDEAPLDSTSSIPKEIPALWPDKPETCPQTSADQALAVARDKKIIAEGKRERSPFRVQDGVAAVPLFEVAAACFRVGGDADTAALMVESGSRLKKQLNEEYDAHRIRLEHVLNVRDTRTAQKEVKTLLAMLEGQQGPYMIWLQNLDRRLALKLGKVKGK
jgi:hypothetical protein